MWKTVLRQLAVKVNTDWEQAHWPGVYQEIHITTVPRRDLFSLASRCPRMFLGKNIWTSVVEIQVDLNGTLRHMVRNQSPIKTDLSAKLVRIPV